MAVPAAGWLAGASALTLDTSDGERLAAVHLPADGGDPDIGVVLAHGFTGSIRRPGLRAVGAALSRYAGVVAFDFRGHGGSTGRSTVGAAEILDLDAAVRTTRELGYRRVVTCGFSMGASVVLRHAALLRGAASGVVVPVDAVVSVSAPSRWYIRDTVPMRRVHWLIQTRAGRVVARRLLGTRIASRGWDPVPLSPLEVVDQIAPIPLLLVHGDADSYFTREHPEALAAAAGAPSELWLIEGFGHAENAATPQLLDRIGRHLRVLLARGPVPNRAG